MGKRQITRGSELATYATIPANRDSRGTSHRTPGDTRGGIGLVPPRERTRSLGRALGVSGYVRNDSGSPDV
ncbi:hypothetical protein GCM10009787_43120 [Streptomyces bangladeshensis]|uniref:Uncharacterized protein n=1 Tax=Streptomyces bangladeshensis TaxID=295352 RepID=A0ABP5NLH7_9ACTN